MVNPWDIKLKKLPREVWTNKDKEKLVSDPEKLNTHIFNGIPKEENKKKISNYFSWMPGPTKSVFPKKGVFLDKNKNLIPDNMEKKKK